MTPFSGRVLPWSARAKAAVAPALAAACLLLFFVGLASPGVRTDAHLRPVLWTLLAGAGGFVGLWLVLLATLGYRLVVDDRGVRLAGRTPIDLGAPRSLSHGRRDTTHLWIAVEGADGRVVVFARRTGKSARLPEWPTAQPPSTPDLFDCAAVDITALRDAVAARI